MRARSLAGAVIALLLAAIGLGATPASAATINDCTGDGTTSVQGGAYIYQQNEWNSTDTQCATVDDSTGAWSMSQANFNLGTNGAPATYPSIFKGCHWGLCSTGSSLPIQVSQLGSATSSWSTSQVDSGAYDVAYDLWINSTPTTSGQPDGTEIMIWLNSRGGVQPFGSRTGTSSAAGHSWDVWTGQQTSWKIISYVYQGGTTSVDNLDIKALIDDATQRGSVNASHYLIDAEAGFEIWQGGQGLASNGFSFSASSGASDPGDTTPPTAPSNLAVSGTTNSTASLTWSPSTDNVGVAGYDVYRGSTPAGTTTSTSFTDTGLSPDTAYTYTVKAKDGSGNVSSASDAVTATTQSGDGSQPGSGACSASYHIDSDWGSGFTGTVTITNTSSSALSSWQTRWTWGGNQQISNYWNTALTQSGTSVTAKNASSNGTVPAGSSTTFGFQASYSGSNTAPTLICGS